jgi:peptidoglycan/xylan/chitin deacetylase (PgdA/CDA1 family)
MRVGFGRRYPFVLCYHGVGTLEHGRDPAGLFLSRGLFERHLDVIEQQRYEVVSVSELWRTMAAGSPAHRLASISFDDALVKTAREAIPRMLERGMACSMFVPTGLMGRHHPDLEGELILDPGELVELAGEGVEIGAHSVDHLWLPGLPYEQILDQMRRSKATLEDLLGKPVTSMAYPYGGHDDATMRAAAEAGFEVACGCSGPSSWSPLSLPRSPIFPSVTTLRLRMKMAGLYGPVHKLVADSGPIGRWRSGHPPADASRAEHLEPRVQPRQRTTV